MTNNRRNDLYTGVFASNGFIDESLLNESRNPNILLNKLQARKGRRGISQLFNRQGSDEDEGDVDNNTSFGIHRISDTLSDPEDVIVEKENVHLPQTQPDSPSMDQSPHLKSYLDVPKNPVKVALSMRHLPQVNIDTSDETSFEKNNEKPFSTSQIPPPSQFAENQSKIINHRKTPPNVELSENESDPESGPENQILTNFKKPTSIPKPLPRKIAPKISTNSMRRSLFQAVPINFQDHNDFVCSTPRSENLNRYFESTLPFSPILKARVGTPRPAPQSSLSSKPPVESRHDIEQQEHHVTSSQQTPTGKRTNNLPRPQITSPERPLPNFSTFQQVRSREIIKSNLEQEIRIRSVYHTPTQKIKPSCVSPLMIPSPRLRSASRVADKPLEDPEDMELPVFSKNYTNIDNLMEVDLQDVPKSTARKFARRNATNYESNNMEETPLKHVQRRPSCTKEVQDRLAVADMSESEEEAVADQNISEDLEDLEEIVGSKQVKSQNKSVNNYRVEYVNTQDNQVELPFSVIPPSSSENFLIPEIPAVESNVLEIPSSEQQMQVDKESQNNSNGSAESTESVEGVEGLPLKVTFNKLKTSVGAMQDTFVLPAKKRKKPSDVPLETLNYLNLTKKAPKQIKKQSLGTSKRHLYSQHEDDEEDDLVSPNSENLADNVFNSFKPPALPIRPIRTQRKSSSEDESLQVEVVQKNGKKSSSSRKETSEKLSRNTRSIAKQRIDALPPSVTSSDEEMPEKEPEPVKAKIIHTENNKPAESSSDSENETNNSLKTVDKLSSKKTVNASESATLLVKPKSSKNSRASAKGKPVPCSGTSSDMEIPDKEPDSVKISKSKVVLQRIEPIESSDRENEVVEAEILLNDVNDKEMPDIPEITVAQPIEKKKKVNRKNIVEVADKSKKSKKSSKDVEHGAELVAEEESEATTLKTKKQQDKIKKSKTAKKSSKKSKAEVEEAENTSYKDLRPMKSKKASSTNQDHEDHIEPELVDHPEGLRRGTRERKLTNMWWSTAHQNVRVRFGIIDLKHVQREYVAKKHAREQTKNQKKSSTGTLSTMVRRNHTEFTICDQLVDQNFRSIIDAKKYYDDAPKKPSKFKRIQVAKDQSSDDEDVEAVTKSPAKSSGKDKKSSKPTDKLKKLAKNPSKRKNPEPEKEKVKVPDPVSESDFDSLKSSRESRKKNKSLLRGPKCARRSLTPSDDNQEDHFDDNNDIDDRPVSPLREASEDRPMMDDNSTNYIPTETNSTFIQPIAKKLSKKSKKAPVMDEPADFVTTLYKKPTISNSTAPDPTTWNTRNFELSSANDMVFANCGHGISFARYFNNVDSGVLRLDPSAMREKVRAKQHSLVFSMLKGDAIFTVDEEIINLSAGDSLKIEPGSSYEIMNPSDTDRVLITFSKNHPETDKSDSSTFSSGSRDYHRAN